MRDFDSFLVDHAACERKASATGMAFVVRYPDRLELVEAMVGFAREELEHYHLVIREIIRRGLTLGPDTKDPYIEGLMDFVRKPSDERFLDRLLVPAVVEARGTERFGLIAKALPTGELAQFYADLTHSEARHHGLFLSFAHRYFPKTIVRDRLSLLLDHEAHLVQTLPIRPALH